MTGSAAFFRIEGAVLSKPTWQSAAYLAANAQGLGERVARLGNLALAAPMKMIGELKLGDSVSRMTWVGLRGMSEDRLVLLGEEYYEEYLKGEAIDVAQDLIKKAKREGKRVVFVSDNIEMIVRHVASELGADDFICNRLEMSGNKATGKLEDPVLSGALSGQWAREFARDRDILLEESVAYGASASDSLLLSAIGEPCALNPDWQLRRLADEHAWPVVEK